MTVALVLAIFAALLVLFGEEPAPRDFDSYAWRQWLDRQYRRDV